MRSQLSNWEVSLTEKGSNCPIGRSNGQFEPVKNLWRSILINFFIKFNYLKVPIVQFEVNLIVQASNCPIWMSKNCFDLKIKLKFPIFLLNHPKNDYLSTVSDKTVTIIEPCPTKTSVLALGVTCALLVLLYISTVFCYYMKKWLSPRKMMH